MRGGLPYNPKSTYNNFNPHSYVRNDHTFNLVPVMFVLFQTTLLRKERQSTQELDRFDLKFQSTLLRKERRLANVPWDGYIAISIHAPA